MQRVCKTCCYYFVGRCRKHAPAACHHTIMSPSHNESGGYSGGWVEVNDYDLCGDHRFGISGTDEKE